MTTHLINYSPPIAVPPLLNCLVYTWCGYAMALCCVMFKIPLLKMVITWMPFVVWKLA